jgi:predicted dehydrogenase
VGIVGYGLAGAVFHAPLVAATPGLEIASVVTSNAERRAQAVREHPGVTVVDTVDGLWEDGGDVDLIVVAAPNVAHVPVARSAIEHGIAVVVDKPFAPTAAEARALAAEADAAGVMLTVFQNRRWDGDFLTLQRLLREGSLGPIARFESRFERWRPEVSRDAWREQDAPEEAGGLLFDLGSHLVDQAMLLFGPPTHVYAELDRRRPGAAVDDDFFVALEHPGGVRSHLGATMLAAVENPRMRVLGLGGTYTKHGLDVQEDALKQGARPGGPGWGDEPPERWGTLATADGERRVETERGAYERFYEGVVECLRGEADPPVDPADAVAGLVVLEAARESAARGDVVPTG